MKTVTRTLPISARYSLDKLERQIEKEICRLDRQLLRVENEESDSLLREMAVERYRAMLADRRRLLEQIREQSNRFIRGVM